MSEFYHPDREVWVQIEPVPPGIILRSEVKIVLRFVGRLIGHRLVSMAGFLFFSAVVAVILFAALWPFFILLVFCLK